MIIDCILDRKDGMKYNPKAFYNKVMEYYNSFPEITGKIANALDNGTNENIRYELCMYIKYNEYNNDICSYILTKDWI